MATDREATALAAHHWQLYLLRCRDGTLYTGISTDVVRRVQEHDTGRGARYTRGRSPVQLLAAWPYADESAARQAEARFKRLPHARKLLATCLAEPP